MVSEMEALRYDEVVKLPEFKNGLDRLLNKKAYDLILSTHSISPKDLSQFVEKAVSEGNAILIQQEWNGYMVIVWKDSQ